MIQFGLGTLKADAVTFGYLQNFSIDFSFDEQSLYSGAGLYPVDVRVHTGDVSGSAEFADINAVAFEKLLGGTRTDGDLQLDNTSYPSTFQLLWTMETDSLTFQITAHKCRSSKLGMSFSRENHVIPNFDFKCYADTSGDVFLIESMDWS